MTATTIEPATWRDLADELTAHEIAVLHRTEPQYLAVGGVDPDEVRQLLHMRAQIHVLERRLLGR